MIVAIVVILHGPGFELQLAFEATSLFDVIRCAVDFDV